MLEGGPVDRGTALPCWSNDAMLRDVAAQNGVGGKSADDRGELIFRVLARLDEDERLSRSADQLKTGALRANQLRAALANGPASARKFFAEWLEERYPYGLDGVARDELAGRLATIDDEVQERELRAKLESAHRVLAERTSSILLLEGTWAVEGKEGDLLLMRTDLRIVDRAGRELVSMPLPDGIAIHVRLDGKLTHHGKNALLRVTQPIHACVMGTVRQHEPTTGCLEIVPIAVFQRG
jgi:hypothetical protein